MDSETSNIFKALFNLVCARHRGPINLDFGQQMQWDGIIAGKCASYVQFLQTDDLYAILDTRINQVVFSTGTAETLEKLLERQMDKTVRDMALSSIKMAHAAYPSTLKAS